jgi:ketosteroid isomerase-like protein
MSQTESTFLWHVALVVIGAMLVAMTFASPLQAAEPTGEAAKVAAAVEALRVAMVAGNEKELNALTDDHLTYGHSKGMLQNKTEFVKFLVGPKAPGKFKWIKTSNQTVEVVGKLAWVRHTFDAENELPDGQITKAHIILLQVWKKDKGKWVLFARQACIPG